MKLVLMPGTTCVDMSMASELGCRPVSHCSLSRGKRINVIAGLSSTGIVAIDVVTSTVSGQEFFDFLRGSLK